MARNQAERQLFDLLVTRNFDPQTLDSQGKPAPTPEDAHLFSFDYKGESGKDYGTVVVMLNDDNSMSVFTGDNTGKSMEGDDKKGWFDFQAQLKRFAMQNLMSFNLQNLNKLKYSMQGQAALSEGLFESWQGKKDVSYNADATQARLMIKHKRNIGEGEARFRNIQALFIETADGERFKLPFTKLSGGRAMLEHVRQGGRPYDMRGAHIANIVNEMNLLARFKRANQSRIFEGEVANLVEQANNYYESLQHSLKSLGSKSGYAKYFETWNPAEITDEDVIIEDLRHMFVEQNIDARVEQALPLLAKLQQEQAMKEINVFEGWMNLLSEGTWALPDTPEKQQQLVGLLSQELPVGPDATNATEQLYDILGDDELFDKLAELAEQDANADARTVILDRLEEMKSNPAVAQVIGKLKIEATPQEQPVQEGESCHVCHKAKPVCECSLHEDDDVEEDDVRGRIENSTYDLVSYLKDIINGDIPSADNMLDSMNDAYGYDSDAAEAAIAADPVVKAVRDISYDVWEALDGGEEDLTRFMPHIKRAYQLASTKGYNVVSESQDTVEKDSKGKVKSWKHEGDWEKTKKVKGKEVDPRGEVTHMSDKARRETEKLKEGTGRTVADLSDEELDSCIDGSTDLNLVRRLAHLNELDSGGVEVEDFGFDFAELVSNNDSESYEANEEWGQSIANNINELLGAGRHIAELNKDTLGSYIKKASSDRAMRNFDQGVDTGSTFQDREPKFDKHNSRKDDQRRSGIHKAVNRLTKEEQLDELSPATLGSYAKKAGGQSAAALGNAFMSEPGERAPHFDRSAKRQKGFKQAINKLTAKAVNESRIMEGGMNEVDILLQDIARGTVDIYNIYAAPKTNVERFVSDQIHDRVEEISRERGIPEDDDIDKILQIIVDDLSAEYGIAETVGGGNWLEETTALTGQYGHTGKLQAVKPQDADMMDRIKFLAGVTK